MLLVNFLPSSRCFALKNLLLNSAGHSVSPGARICTPLFIFGRGRVIVGSDSWISPFNKFYTQLDGPIYIGDNCDIGHDCIFIPGSHEIGCIVRRAGISTCETIIINSGSWIGAGSIFFGGSSVGRSSVIGARSTVFDKLAENSLSAGTPCRLIRNL